MNINGDFSEKNGVYQGHDLVQKLAVLTRFRMQLHVRRAKFYCLRQGTSKRGEGQPFLSC